MRIPITMCHGIRDDGEKPLPVERLDALMRVASEMGFSSITYDQYAAWRYDGGTLPDRPIMIDFDHPIKNMRYETHDTLAKYGYVGNLFMYTRPYDREYDRDLPWDDSPDDHMTWEEIGELRELGWSIGAHTVSHPNLSDLSQEDPTGERMAIELDRCNELIERYLGFRPRTSLSPARVGAALPKRRSRNAIGSADFGSSGRSTRPTGGPSAMPTSSAFPERTRPTEARPWPLATPPRTPIRTGSHPWSSSTSSTTPPTSAATSMVPWRTDARIAAP